jgi:DNA-binding HxlR family transcriptional regulator
MRCTAVTGLADASPRRCAFSVNRMSTLYDRKCPIARTLEIIGERWTILILRDLVVEGPRKFQDLLVSLSGISPNTLSARLKTLEDGGIIERRFYEDHPPRAEYVLTEKGRDLRPVLRTLKDWGQKHTSVAASR